MRLDRIILGDREITTIGNILVTVCPADGAGARAADLLRICEKRKERGFVLGIYDFGILMGALQELDQDIPIEIGLSVETAGSRARMLRIAHDDTIIYLAGLTRNKPEDPYPEPDTLTKILRENEALRERIAELELRSGGWA